MRTKLLWIMALVILAVVNYAVWQKEQALAAGRTLLLELAPVDPRSLMQGDYMVLNYRLAGDIRARLTVRSTDGLAVVNVDDQGHARFDHVHQAGDALQPDQALIRFRKRGAVVRIGAEAFFFEEGEAQVYEPARFGELKVSGDGEVILIGLRDDKLMTLGEKLISR